MKNIVLVLICLLIGFFFGRQASHEKVIEKIVPGETIRETITNIVADTVYLAGELRYEYVYVPDPIDVPVIDREATIAATVEDWNKIREYNKLLFDNNNGKLSLDLKVQYNELQRLSYTFTPVHKETTIVKRRVFVPFISASVLDFKSVSIGGGLFYHNLGFRAEWATGALNFGIMYKF